jgi:hypothetical protein
MVAGGLTDGCMLNSTGLWEGQVTVTAEETAAAHLSQCLWGLSYLALPPATTTYQYPLPEPQRPLTSSSIVMLLGARGMSQVVEYLPSKNRALSSYSNSTKTKLTHYIIML